MRAVALMWIPITTAATLVVAAVVGPHAIDPFAPDMRLLNSIAPSGRHWLGTDEIGRDMGARVMLGAQWSLRTALVASILPLLAAVWGAHVLGRAGPARHGFITMMLTLIVIASLGASLIAAEVTGISLGWAPLAVANAFAASILLSGATNSSTATTRSARVRWFVQAVLLFSAATVVTEFASSQAAFAQIGYALQPPSTSLGILGGSCRGDLFCRNEYWWLWVMPLAATVTISTTFVFAARALRPVAATPP
ncbi:MAG: hypothetical protein H7287_08180 [Thermoleophilia bacterium]|nr:hypothetical protein [Thermoleophilia bacterium]